MEVIERINSTIEIVSVGASRLKLNQNIFEIALIKENKLESHLGLFYDWLIEQAGVIVHLSNPNFKKDKNAEFFAGELNDWSFEPTTIELPNIDNGETGANQVSGFKFSTNYQIEVALILGKAIRASPKHIAYFLTGIQFGADEGEMEDMHLTDFWNMHDRDGLRWNTLYKLIK